MTTVIRAARPSDADEIALAHIEGWRVGYRHLLPAEFLDAPEFAAERRDRWRAWTWPQFATTGEVFVAEIDDRVVGFGHCGPERLQPECDQAGTDQATRFSDVRGEVYGFYLHPDAWGSGAAAPLMQRCSRFLAERGFAHAVLWVLRDNPRARSFYAKAGWAPTGREILFMGPQTAQALPTPLPEVEYEIRLPVGNTTTDG